MCGRCVVSHTNSINCVNIVNNFFVNSLTEVIKINETCLNRLNKKRKFCMNPKNTPEEFYRNIRP